MSTDLATVTGPFRKARASNVVSAAFPSRVPTVTPPPISDTTITTNTTVQAVELGLAAGGLAPNWAMIVPYGLGSDNNAFSMRVVGYRPVGSLWIPLVLAGWTACTMSSNIPGIAGAPVIATEFFCDSMTLDTAFTNNAGISNETVVPGTDLVAHGMVALKGCTRLEITYITTTGTPTCNALVFLA